MPVSRTIFTLFLLFLFACARPLPYVASMAVLEKLQPNREVLPASRGCSICHRIFTERFAYRYYPVRISHKAHAKLGINCTFCHRKAASSTNTGDYLMPEGHNFKSRTSVGYMDNNPCRVCHLYFSDIGKKDRRIPAGCRTCHPSYAGGEPLPFIWWKYRTNLTNNHKRHFDMGLPCLRCHVGFDKMDDTTLAFTPKMDICYECHGAAGERKIVEGDKGPIEAARALFLQNCATCHGVDGKGDGPTGAFFKAGLRPGDLTDSSRTGKRTDQQIHDIILKGGPELNLSERMPAWEGLLTEEDVVVLVKYIRHISDRHE